MSTRTPPRQAPSAAMHDRIRARRRKVRAQQTRRRRRLAGSLLAVLALAGMVVGVVRSPLFAITDIRVSGVDAQAAVQVVSATGLRQGDNLLFADLAGAEERAGRLAWVRSVRAERVPPSVVSIQVVRREPVAVLRTAAGLWLVDTEGVVLGGGAGEGLVEIAAAGDVVARVGEPVAAPAVDNALAVHASLPGPLRSVVVRYDAPTVTGLRVLLEAGGAGVEDDLVWVRFGSAERSDAKARVVGLLLAEARDRAGTGVELDVRAPDNPVLVPVPAGGG